MNTFVTSVRCGVLAALFVALSCLGAGCGPSGFQKDFQKMQAATKEKHKAAEIQTALAPFFADESTLTNRLPDTITALPVFADDPKGIEVAKADCADGLLLYIGSGFGHWGLLVARPGHAKDICDWHRARTTLWADGVYFFSE